jgi:DNA polymerase-1
LDLNGKEPCFVDIECDSLNPTAIWLAVTKYKGEVRTWIRPTTPDLAVFLADKLLVGHNILGFDLPVLRKLADCRNTWSGCVDTLVCSRLRNHWGINDHSLEAWGERLGYSKIHFPPEEFNPYGPVDYKRLEEYCKRDVEVTEKLWEKLTPFISNTRYHKALALEHFSAQDCSEMQQNGFQFNVENARKLAVELDERLEVLDAEMQEDFPPKKIEEEFIPKRDNKTKGYKAGVPFTKVTYKAFNPRSTKDRIERLWECGWKPVDKTKGHIQNRDKDKEAHYKFYGWKTNEANLDTLPTDAPEGARKLVEYLVLSSRRSTLEEWFNAYNKTTGRIHGNFKHIGAWTHRKAHSAPNMGNIPSPPDTGGKEYEELTEVQRINVDYNARMREFWEVPTEKRLVGVDAEGIQLRILAHYVGNPEYTESIVNGRKEDESDIHNVNKRALGLPHLTRDHAKTFIYAWLLGAGTGKIGEILDCGIPNARDAMENFLRSIDGLSELKRDRIPYDAERGYFFGLDGRVVICDSEHHMLAGYLQNGESVIMKWADRIWKRKLRQEKIPFLKVDDVHDEWQTEVPEEYAEYVMQTQINSIVQAGEELGVNCPLAGSGNIGMNWKETH